MESHNGFERRTLEKHVMYLESRSEMIIIEDMRTQWTWLGSFRIILHS